jgi:hypothetical protein
MSWASNETGPYNAKEWLNPSNDVLVSNRPSTDAGWAYPGSPYSPLATGFYASNGSLFMKQGMFSQNSSNITDNAVRYSGIFGTDANPNTVLGASFYTDADGVVRRAMGGYVTGSPASTTVGLPMAATFSSSGSVPANQSQSRPWILHRPFRSVAELGYVFSGNPWKNLDFLTPESGDAALLDVFTVNETTDPSGLVTGKLNLNTKQAPVLGAVLSNAYTDEQTPSSGAIGQGVANTIAADGTSGLIARTTSNISSKGALLNVSELVGKWVSKQTTATGTAPHNINGSLSYAGFSNDLGALLTTAYGANTSQTNIQRFREAPIRALANVGTTRVWNLMIDVIAQTGSYNAGESNLDNFTVSDEQRYWLHVAIDRYTGTVLDQSLEPVVENPPTAIALNNSTLTDNKPVGTAVGALSATDPTPNSTFTFALVDGTGSTDNASFAISGNTLQTAAVLQYLAQSSFSILLSVTDQNGLSYRQPFTITAQPGSYTQWKITNFGASANDPAVAGDNVVSANDGLPNLVKYTIGKVPAVPDTSGITVQTDGTVLTMNYTVADSATDVTAHAYWTTDLTNPNGWGTTAVTETMLSDDGTVQHWQATVPVNLNNQIFMRLQVTSP